MQNGYFLEYFFSQAGELGEPNHKGEYVVHCPFEHNKGFEQTPSAHVNIEKAVFHCKTCRAEGRFNAGGLSEVDFIAHYYKISYEQALVWKESYYNDDESMDSWSGYVSSLQGSPRLEFLQKSRGLTLETIKTYNLGYDGSGIVYPVTIFGVLADVRTYSPDSRPKMISRKGATTLLFPFDHWREDDRPTMLVGGENDALIGRQLGFNALTFTGGEGALPTKMFLNMFQGKDVYICYDCDEAGRKGAARVAYFLKEAGANVFMMDLALPGTKEDKDLSDFVVKHGKSYADVLAIMQAAPVFSEKDFQEEKNKEFPLLELWETTEGKYHGRRASARVVMVGKYDMDMYVPTAVKFQCGYKPRNKDDEEEHIQNCPLAGYEERKKIWTLTEDNLKDALYLAELKEQEQWKALMVLNKISPKEVCVKQSILSRESLHKVIFAPDVETESELGGFRAVEQYAYVIGHRLNDGDRYRIFHKAYAHPNDRQRAYLVVDRVEDSDNAVNTFRMTDNLKNQLNVFRGPPEEMMHKRAEMAKGIVGGFASDMIVWGVDLVYHSPLRFQLFGGEIKGYPEVAIIGESRTGKSDTATKLQAHYRLGNRIALKGASVAGLMGGADKMPNGGFRIKWGAIPRNDKGLIALDEVSGAPQEVLQALTDMRSSGEATLTKIGGPMKAPARTRLIWLGNPRPVNGRSKSLMEYPNGVEAVLDLIGTDEDVARFDAVMLIVDRGVYIRPDTKGEYSPHDRELYQDLIRWIWSRKPEQIVFDGNVEDYIWSRSLILNESYAADIKLLGAEASKKLARFAVACAACCFSCDDTGENLIVKKEHVDWAESFLNRCYDSDVFRMKDYVDQRRKYVTTTPMINDIVAGIMRSDTGNMIVRELLSNTEPIPQFNLQAMSGTDRDDFNTKLSFMARHYLIYNKPKGVSATLRLRKAVQHVNEARMIPLSERE